ncbi:MAG: ABC transporter permease [Bacteroidota bacterium]
MLRLFVLIAVRNLHRNRGFALLNVVGLGLGLACVLMIGLYVLDELRFDRFHAEAERIVWVTADIIEDGERDQTNSTQGILAPYLEEDIPDVEAVVRVNTASPLFVLDGEPHRIEDVRFADASFFEVFDGFQAVQGTLDLTRPDQMVMTQSLASRLFGSANPVGETIESASGPLTIVGVVADPPTASTLQFAAVVSSSTMKDPPSWMYENWTSYAFDTYAKLRPGSRVSSFQAQLPGLVASRAEASFAEIDSQLELTAIPLLDAHLRSGRPGTRDAAGLWAFAAIGLFVLLLACVNFTNLSTARSLERAHEVGVRKALGAGRSSLATQFLIEAVMLSILALVLAVLLVQALAPWTASVTGKTLTLSALGPWLPAVVGLAVVTGLLAGAYPALVLSHFQPLEALRGRFASGSRGSTLRRGLVVFQFTVTVALLLGTATVFEQLRYMQSQDLGFGPEAETEQLVALDFAGDESVSDQLGAFQSSLEALPGVIESSSSISRLAGGQPSAGGFIESPDGTQTDLSVTMLITDEAYVSVHGLDVVAGRTPRLSIDREAPAEYLLNDSAIREVGYASPEDALGKSATFWGFEGTVVGVVRDFHTQGLQSTINPLAITALPQFQSQLTLRIRSDGTAETLAQVQDVWAEFAPSLPYEPIFLDEAFGQLYDTERRLGRVVALFASLAVAIACLGLFGLAAHAAAQRRREIGVRRALGAPVGHVVGLLTRDTVVLVCVSIVVGVPVAMWLMEQWLTGFAYRTTIGPGLIGGVSLLVLLVSTATVGAQAFRAAIADPVHALRSE